MRTTRFFALFASVGFVAACGGTQNVESDQPASEPATEPAAETASLRLVHAALAPTVDIYAGDTQLADDVSLGQFTAERLTVPAGPHTISLHPAEGGDAIISWDVTLDAGGDFTVVVVGNVDSPTRDGQLDAVVLADDLSGGEGSRTRFVHAVPGGPGVTFMAGSTGYAVDVAYKTATEYYNTASEPTEFSLQAGGESIFADTVALASGRVFTVIARPTEDGGIAFTVANDRAE